MEDYVQYHNSDKRGFSCFELAKGSSFQIVTNKALAKKLIGSRVWLVGGEGKPRRYYLCFTFVVNQVQEGTGEFRYMLSGHKGLFFDPPILLNHFPWFRDFLKSQQNFSMGLRKIEKIYVAELQRISRENNWEMEEKGIMQNHRRGAGFGSAVVNREVERVAVALVKEDYRRRGWRVDSVETEKKGYDLICRKGNQQQLVEVKGVRGDDISFIITAGEVKRAKTNDDFVLYVVTSALTEPQIHRFTAKEFRERFDLEPISYRAVMRER